MLPNFRFRHIYLGVLILAYGDYAKSHSGAQFSLKFNGQIWQENATIIY